MEVKGLESKILVVDDEPVNIELLEAYLNTAEYEVVTAYGGEEALKRVESEKPDLILLDVMMPRLNGFEVCKILKEKEETRFIPVVMITALKEKEEKIKGLGAGADDFLTKPVDSSELLTRVKSLLRIKYLHDELTKRYESTSITLNDCLAAAILVAKDYLGDPYCSTFCNAFMTKWALLWMKDASKQLGIKYERKNSNLDAAREYLKGLSDSGFVNVDDYELSSEGEEVFVEIKECMYSAACKVAKENGIEQGGCTMAACIIEGIYEIYRKSNLDYVYSYNLYKDKGEPCKIRIASRERCNEIRMKEIG